MYVCLTTTATTTQKLRCHLLLQCPSKFRYQPAGHCLHGKRQFYVFLVFLPFPRHWPIVWNFKNNFAKLHTYSPEKLTSQTEKYIYNKKELNNQAQTKDQNPACKHLLVLVVTSSWNPFWNHCTKYLHCKCVFVECFFLHNFFCNNNISIIYMYEWKTSGFRNARFVSN